MPSSRWKTTSTHDATWSLRWWICALVVPFSGQKRLISPVRSSLMIQYPCADYTRGVVSLYGERTPGVLIPHWKMTPTRHAIRSLRWWMYAFPMSLSGRRLHKGELCHNMMKWLWEFLSHVVKQAEAWYRASIWRNHRKVVIKQYRYVFVTAITIKSSTLKTDCRIQRWCILQ